MKGSEKEPTSDLTAIERFHFRSMSWLHSNSTTQIALNVLQSTLGKSWVEFGTSKTVYDHHFDRFLQAPADRSIMIVSNHRSYFDMFVIAARLFRKFGRHHRIFFPVRGNFFYDNPLGLLVNLFVAYGAMFPPLLRDRSRLSWNRHALELMKELLREPNVMLGMHPEGKRNKSDNPYSLLSAQPGCGELIYHSRPTVIPLFLQGFPRYAWSLIPRNLKAKDDSNALVHMVMGHPMDFSKEFAMDPSRDLYVRISKKVMQQIKVLGEEEKTIRAAA